MYRYPSEFNWRVKPSLPLCKRTAPSLWNKANRFTYANKTWGMSVSECRNGCQTVKCLIIWNSVRLNCVLESAQWIHQDAVGLPEFFCYPVLKILFCPLASSMVFSTIKIPGKLDATKCERTLCNAQEAFKVVSFATKAELEVILQMPTQLQA